MSSYSPQEIAALLRKFGIERDRYVKRLARDAGLGRTEFDALDYIEEAGELTPNQLSARLFLTSGATTALIDRLEAAGMVSRSQNPADRRSVILRLTRKTDQTGAKNLSAYVRDIQAAARRLTASERAAVATFLEDAVAAAVKNVQRDGASE